MGEARRRKMAGTYPTAEQIAGYSAFSSKLRSMFARIEEREIGLAWMRAEGAGIDMPLGAPHELVAPPDAVVMHVIWETATCNGALLASDIPGVIGAFRASGMSRKDARQAITCEMATQRHMISEVGRGTITTALALAFTGEGAPILQALIRNGPPMPRLTYRIEDYIDPPTERRAINFRLSINAAGELTVPPSLAEMPVTGRPE